MLYVCMYACMYLRMYEWIIINSLSKEADANKPPACPQPVSIPPTETTRVIWSVWPIKVCSGFTVNVRSKVNSVCSYLSMFSHQKMCRVFSLSVTSSILYTHHIRMGACLSRYTALKRSPGATSNMHKCFEEYDTAITLSPHTAILVGYAPRGGARYGDSIRSSLNLEPFATSNPPQGSK